MLNKTAEASSLRNDTEVGMKGSYACTASASNQ